SRSLHALPPREAKKKPRVPLPRGSLLAGFPNGLRPRTPRAECPAAAGPAGTVVQRPGTRDCGLPCESSYREGDTAPRGSACQALIYLPPFINSVDRTDQAA